MSVTVVVTGGRHETRQKSIFDALDAFHKEHRIGRLTEGGAMGVDRICRLWAQTKGISVVTEEARWNRGGKYNPNAGKERNWRMARMDHDFLLSFPGNRGTKHMTDAVNGLREEGVIKTQTRMITLA